MVLLTSSAVSVAISGAIICAFTFLLFLSGYVLQQRTVRSLQEAIRQPPERHPAPTLLPPFAAPENVVESEDSAKVEEVAITVDVHRMQKQQPFYPTTPEVVAMYATMNGPHVSERLTPTTASSQSHEGFEQLESLAYILTVPQPEDLCSAALFAQQQRQNSNLSRKPAIIFLYPSTWEASPSPLHIAALTFLRDIQEEYSLVYHPVDISAVWSGVDINSQLLGELQRNRWDYDRMLHLKSPGMILDNSALDQALRFSNTKLSWAPVSASAGHDPELLLWSRMKGLLMPRGEMRKLTMSAVTSHSDHHKGEMDIEARAKNAAYVLFEEEELLHRRSEKEWYGGLFETFERQRSSICKGRGILHGDQDRIELRRRI